MNHKRMTRHEEHGQTVTATSEYSASYAVWKMFQAGDTPHIKPILVH